MSASAVEGGLLEPGGESHVEERQRKDVVTSASVFWWIILLRAHLMVDQTDEGNFVQQSPLEGRVEMHVKVGPIENFGPL